MKFHALAVLVLGAVAIATLPAAASAIKLTNTVNPDPMVEHQGAPADHSTTPPKPTTLKPKPKAPKPARTP